MLLIALLVRAPLRSFRHLTYHLSHSYISTHSLRSHWPFPFCVFLGQSGYETRVLIQRERHRLVAIRVGQDRDFTIHNLYIRSMGSAAGGAGGGAAAPQILEENFSIHSAPQILAGFVVKCFNSIIKF